MSNQLQNKLFHYSANPPETTWDNISSSLNDEMPGMAKLNDFEQEPSSLVWSKLTAQLDSDTSNQKYLPFLQRYHKPLHYLSAASIISIVAITIALLINKDAVSDELVYQPAIEKTNSEVLKIKDDLPGNNVETNDQNKIIHPNNVDTPSSHSNSFSKNSRYLTVATQKGNSVRLSQKALRVFNCAENRTAVNNIRCKENIQLLQQKMATSLVSPTGDFAGLIDMIKHLDENL